MKHIAIDLETTGLDPDRDEIIQIGAIVETDFQQPLKDLPKLRLLIEPTSYGRRRIQQNPYVTEMHEGLLREIDHPSSAPYRGGDAEREAIECLISFILAHSQGEKAIVSGKNFAAFDIRFLRAKAPDVEWHKVFRHRYLDPGSMFYDGHDAPPSLSSIAEREGIEYRAHDALGDCEAVIQAIRLFVGRVGE